MPASATRQDGRHARRERTRNAVVDAAFELVQEGKTPPDLDLVAERSGVSVSTIFRAFDGVDDVRRQAIERFEERFTALSDVDADPQLDRPERIARFVRARIDFFEAAGPLLRIAQQRAVDSDVFAASVARSRERSAEQTHRCFRRELSSLSSAEAANLAALVDTTTSYEAYGLATATHARGGRQLANLWRRAVEVLLDAWCGPDVSSHEQKGAAT